MYCSSCGIEVSKELNYCNRCGANLTVNQAPQIYVPPVKMTGPVNIPVSSVTDHTTRTFEPAYRVKGK